MDLDFDNTEINRLHMAMNNYPEINGVQDPLRRLMKMAGLLDNEPIPLPDNLEERDGTATLAMVFAKY